MATGKKTGSEGEGVTPILLPLIDLSPGRIADAAGRKEEIGKLLDCFSSVGFCQITGIPGWEL